MKTTKPQKNHITLSLQNKQYNDNRGILPNFDQKKDKRYVLGVISDHPQFLLFL